MGFLGTLKTAKSVQQLNLSKDGSRLVVLEESGVIEVVNTITGKLGEPVFAKGGQRFESITVTDDAKTAYVIDSDSRLLRVDFGRQRNFGRQRDHNSAERCAGGCIAKRRSPGNLWRFRLCSL